MKKQSYNEDKGIFMATADRQIKHQRFTPKETFQHSRRVICSICNLSTTEDYIHLFFSCPFAQQCWNCIGITWDLTLEFMNMIMIARRLFTQPFRNWMLEYLE